MHRLALHSWTRVSKCQTTVTFMPAGLGTGARHKATRHLEQHPKDPLVRWTESGCASLQSRCGHSISRCEQELVKAGAPHVSDDIESERQTVK